MPERGDPLRLAELGRAYEGELEPAALGRLEGLLAGGDGLIRYSIRFDRDDRGRPYVAGHLEGTLPLECQRCLKGFGLDVRRDWQVTLLAEAAEEALLDEGEDARLVTDQGMRLAELIEDELILAVPLVPKHPAGANCELPGFDAAAAEPEEEAGPEGPEENPFAELARLKRGSRDS